MKKVLQLLVIKTSFPPFSWLYKAYYKLTVYCCVFVLRLFPEVTSVYLTGGIVSGRVVYGLSDIDLIVFVSGKKPRITRLCRRLSFFFPLLSLGEPAIYEEAEVENYIRYSSDVKHLFLGYRLSADSQLSRLLYGKNMLQSQPVSEAHLNEGVLGQVWSIAINKLIVQKTDGVSLRYLNLKLRRQLGEDVAVPSAHQIQAASANEVEETFQLCFHKIKKLADEKAKTYLLEPDSSSNMESMKLQKSETVLLTQKSKAQLQSFVNAVTGRFPCIKSILVSPVSYLSLEEDRLGLFLVVERALSLQEIKEIKETLGLSQSVQGLELYILTPYVAFSVQWVGSDWWHPSPLLWAWSEPLTFLHLEAEHCRYYGEPFHYSSQQRQMLQRAFAQQVQKTLSLEKAKRLHYVGHKNRARLTPWDFQHLFWQALQIKTAEQDNVVICSSEQLAKYWDQQLGTDWISQLQLQLSGDLDKRKTQTERLYALALQLLSQLYPSETQVVDANKTLLKDVQTYSAPTVSVIIATYNRAEFLRETLHALTLQTRPPDQLVVVDNNSSDHTCAVVEQFSELLPLTYVFEPQQGVAFARNRGIRHAAGEIIAFTDDDCIPDPQWLEYLELPFIRDPSIGLVGGRISPRAHHLLNWVESYSAALHLMQEGDEKETETIKKISYKESIYDHT